MGLAGFGRIHSTHGVKSCASAPSTFGIIASDTHGNLKQGGTTEACIYIAAPFLPSHPPPHPIH